MAYHSLGCHDIDKIHIFVRLITFSLFFMSSKPKLTVIRGDLDNSPRAYNYPLSDEEIRAMPPPSDELRAKMMREVEESPRLLEALATMGEEAVKEACQKIDKQFASIFWNKEEQRYYYQTEFDEVMTARERVRRVVEYNLHTARIRLEK